MDIYNCKTELSKTIDELIDVRIRHIARMKESILVYDRIFTIVEEIEEREDLDIASEFESDIATSLLEILEEGEVERKFSEIKMHNNEFED